MAGEYSQGASSFFVTSTAGMIVGDTIEIMMDNNEFFSTTIASIIPPNVVSISGSIPHSASAGNILIDITQSKNVTASESVGELT